MMAEHKLIIGIDIGDVSQLFMRFFVKMNLSYQINHTQIPYYKYTAIWIYMHNYPGFAKTNTGRAATMILVHSYQIKKTQI